MGTYTLPPSLAAGKPSAAKCTGLPESATWTFMHLCSCGTRPAPRSAARFARSLGVRAALLTDPRTGLQTGCSLMWPTAGTWCDIALLSLHAAYICWPCLGCCSHQWLLELLLIKAAGGHADAKWHAWAQVCDFTAYANSPLYLINKPNAVRTATVI